MMRLTRKKAIEISIELWEWLAETGGLKRNWPGWRIYDSMALDCPLCEYSNRKNARKKVDAICDEYCPIKNCYKAGYKEWDEAGASKARKKYATLFLETLRALK